jgi:hypothetical protein
MQEILPNPAWILRFHGDKPSMYEGVWFEDRPKRKARFQQGWQAGSRYE